MLTGNYPFKGQNERDLFGKISKGMFNMPETVPFEAKRLISRMLSVDASKRPTAKEVIRFLNKNLVMPRQMAHIPQSSGWWCREFPLHIAIIYAEYRQMIAYITKKLLASII